MNTMINNAKNAPVALMLSMNDAPKSYASKANAQKAVEKRMANFEINHRSGVQHFIIVQNDHGRYVPVFLGERALQAGLHFSFCVAG